MANIFHTIFIKIASGVIALGVSIGLVSAPQATPVVVVEPIVAPATVISVEAPAPIVVVKPKMAVVVTEKVLTPVVEVSTLAEKPIVEQPAIVTPAPVVQETPAPTLPVSNQAVPVVQPTIIYQPVYVPVVIQSPAPTPAPTPTVPKMAITTYAVIKDGDTIKTALSEQDLRDFCASLNGQIAYKKACQNNSLKLVIENALAANGYEVKESTN